jgi:hydrogenase small subunit
MGTGGAGLVGVSLIGLPGLEKLLAATIADVPVVWIQGGSCTGCSVSVLNSVSPTIQELLLGEVIPGKHVSMAFHPNVSAGQGDEVVKILRSYARGERGTFVLVVEGAVSTKDDGVYCEVGEENGHGITVLRHVKELAAQALAVINIGTCSAYGGIPGADPNPTGIKPVGTVLEEAGIKTPVVNVPGCPPHPDWFVGTVATVLVGGLGALDVDDYGRPKAFYGNRIHDNCQLRGQFDQGHFAESFSEDGCLYKLGCKGPVAHADCSHRKWNNGANWCIGSGSPCIGCVEPEFPYQKSLLDVVPIHDRVPPAYYPPIVTTRSSDVMPAITGAIGAGVGLAVGVGLAKRRNNKKAAEENADSESGEA